MSKTNDVRLIGVFGQEPKKIITQDGKVIVSFSFATHEKRKDAAGNYNDHTDWHNCVAFGKLAELIATHMAKGSRAALYGSLRTRQYQDKDNNARYATEIIVDEILFLASGANNQGSTTQD